MLSLSPFLHSSPLSVKAWSPRA
uniref:Uncharacterized protein n=1 Tax=Anguilla anguilla TaxID=7936 RepID=A0A0E9SM27_ANGAN